MQLPGANRISLLILALAIVTGFPGVGRGQENSSAEPLELQMGLLAIGGESPQNLAKRLYGAEALYGGNWIRKNVEEFSAANPNIHLTLSSIDRPRRYEKSLGDLPGMPADIIGIDSSMGYETAYLSSNDLIVPIEQFLPDPEFDKNDFYPNLWNSVEYKGKTWGVPWVGDGLFLACNWPLFEAEKIDHPPTTWTEFMDYGVRLTKDLDGDGTFDQFGAYPFLNDGDSMGVIVTSVILQSGGHIVTESGIDMSHPSIATALNVFKDAVKSPFGKQMFQMAAKLQNVPNQSVVEIMDGFPYAMYILSPSRLAMLPKNGNFRLSYLPTEGTQTSMSYGRLYLAVRKSTPEREKAAWNVVKWICCRKNCPLPEAWAGYPCRKDFIERQDVKDGFSKSKIENIDIVYKSMAWSRDTAPHMVGRFEALHALAVVGVAYVLGGADTIEKMRESAERAARPLIKPFDPSMQLKDLKR